MSATLDRRGDLDVARFAEKRDANGQGRVDLALAVVPVALQAIALQHLSFLIVYETFDLVTYLWRGRHADQRVRAQERTHLKNQTLKNVGVCFGSIGLGALGYGVGTLIHPGTGTSIVGLISETLLYLL